jgi:hypothetical protein
MIESPRESKIDIVKPVVYEVDCAMGFIKLVPLLKFHVIFMFHVLICFWVKYIFGSYKYTNFSFNTFSLYF